MTGKSIHEELAANFKTATREQWQEQASKENNGNDPFLSLAWKAGKTEGKPYYDLRDAAGTSWLNSFILPPADEEFAKPKTWLNMPALVVDDEQKANGHALHFLNTGADGVVFQLSADHPLNIEQLLKNIEWPYCSLHFMGTSGQMKALEEYIEAQKYPNNSLHGVFLSRAFSATDATALHTFHLQPNVKRFGLLIESDDATEQLEEALLKAVQLITQLQEAGISTETIIRHIAFSLPVDNNFLITIAKLKALRILWYPVTQAYNFSSYQPEALHIHVRSEVWINEAFQPHGNMLKSTTAALASVLGGCTSITLLPEDQNNTMMQRIARNVSNILREESHLDKVSDPVAGSYAIDALIHDLAKNAWLGFQEKVKQIQSLQV